MEKVSSAERKHIVFIGKRNVGKSSLINAFAGQHISIVSKIAGTTTDPVRKAMELLPFGPVVLVDTAGIDDTGELGEKRVTKTLKSISSADFVLYVIDAQNKIDKIDKLYIEKIKIRKIPFAFVITKSDLEINKNLINNLLHYNVPINYTSVKNQRSIHQLKENVIKLMPDEKKIPLISDLVKKGEILVLVVPIDPGAPKGRIIKPQVEVLREALDNNIISVVVQAKDLKNTLPKLKEKPSLVVTDSQAIELVSEIVPEEIPLTTFSILMARTKGNIKTLLNDLEHINRLSSNSKVLIAEACTHHAQKEDIGRIKIPNWLRNHTKKNLHIDVVAGRDFPDDLSEYDLIIHCGGCMITRTEMQSRLQHAQSKDIPIVNYGLIISYMHNVIQRVLKPLAISP